MIKVFGVGNILLSDDGIGVKVIERIQPFIEELGKNIEVVIGETDYVYCLDNVSDDDFVILVDSTYFAHRPGTVTIRTLESCDEFIGEMFSEHEVSLLKALRIEKPNNKGYLIGIEVENVDYGLDLSKSLANKFDSICRKVLDDISLILEGHRLVEYV